MVLGETDLIFRTLVFDTVYTEQELGADFPKELGTSRFLNALKIKNKKLLWMEKIVKQVEIVPYKL